ncbi:MAG: hypothetical protein RBG13Loki_3449 [Promethearchaeota archaeon CR_4]|nr:MAG: hypothetical protein RBG13Loki_3449 [Candidatus Lokiarchaeota archaeon CR_4]
MAKGDGVVFNVIGFVIALISIFLEFWRFGVSHWIPSEEFELFVTRMDLWGEGLTHIGDYFSQIENVINGLRLLFPLLFIVAGICILVGVQKKVAPGVGAVILLLYPIVYLICNIIVPSVTGGNFGDLFLTMQVGAYLMIAAGVLCAVGAAKNGEY